MGGRAVLVIIVVIIVKMCEPERTNIVRGLGVGPCGRRIIIKKQKMFWID